ncbi:hypothetical protein EV421DRAFT_1734927 [Armillaria borealis]|uniref:Uncharacterized protein n=1 Tax=Armillaria borealis TaxID=47425 RepID=A0AA39JM94_9AGAR|nr:hypothetical protein EV421DRAFT_1734927 [Armillaria borealis]
MQIVLFLNSNGPFSASGGPKNPRLRVSCPHDRCDSTLHDSNDNTRNVSNDDDVHGPPPWPQIRPPSPSQPNQYLWHRHRCQSLQYTTSAHYNGVYYVGGFDIGCHLNVGGAIERKTGHNDDDEDDGDDDNDEGGGGRALLRRPENVWGRGAVEGEGGGSTLEGGRRRGGGWHKDRDGDDDQALLGIEG